MPKLIFSYKECGWREENGYCGYPIGTPWCSIHEHDLKDGFPWNCPLGKLKIE